MRSLAEFKREMETPELRKRRKEESYFLGMMGATYGSISGSEVKGLRGLL